MEPTRSSRGSPEIADSLRFEEEIQSLMLDSSPPPPPPPASSFTALLGLPPPQAVELLHLPAISPTFPSNAALVDRAARFSVFAASAAGESNSAEVKMKVEPADSGGTRVAGKRKEADKSKVKGSAKKSKNAEEDTGGEKLPYVHVRARRGQATDSHSLAERARREKINARMKLLQELVPGCNKISGTALVLDEIINHVQSLQRQVEFLSMRLASVNPRVEFTGLDNILSNECDRLMMGGGPFFDGGKQPLQTYHHQVPQNWLIDHHHHQQQKQQQQQTWERDDTQQNHDHPFISNPNTVFSYDASTPIPVSLPNQLKTEM